MARSDELAIFACQPQFRQNLAISGQVQETPTGAAAVILAAICPPSFLSLALTIE